MQMTLNLYSAFLMVESFISSYQKNRKIISRPKDLVLELNMFILKLSNAKDTFLK